ncbi:hypothetical protein SB761_32200, partial [Pseudomonas sp. SIMBA_064]
VRAFQAIVKIQNGQVSIKVKIFLRQRGGIFPSLFVLRNDVCLFCKGSQDLNNWHITCLNNNYVKMYPFQAS